MTCKAALVASALAVACVGCQREHSVPEGRSFSRTVEPSTTTDTDAARRTVPDTAPSTDIDTHADENVDTSGITGGNTADPTP